MNTAVILAGGIGSRMGLEVPKQFALVKGKPVIIFTLESFQNHPSIDSIGVVCVDGWHDILQDYATEYAITKLDWIISGGKTVQESIYNGVRHLENICHPQDTVIIHDGIRPLLDASVISDVLATCRTYGNGVAALPYNEQIFEIDSQDPASTVHYFQRDTLRRVSTPQAYHFDVLARHYREAFDMGIGIGPSCYTNTMMVDFGERLYFAAGSNRNVKLTTLEDLMVFQALLDTADGTSSSREE